METESNISLHSIPISLATVGVHDLIISENMFGKPMVQRKGKYAILKADITTLDLKRDDPMEAYHSKD